MALQLTLPLGLKGFGLVLENIAILSQSIANHGYTTALQELFSHGSHSFNRKISCIMNKMCKASSEMKKIGLIKLTRLETSNLEKNAHL